MYMSLKRVVFSVCAFVVGIYLMLWTNLFLTSEVSPRHDSADAQYANSTPIPLATQNVRSQPEQRVENLKSLAKNDDEIGACSFKFRQQRVQEMCDTSPPPRRNTKLADKLMSTRRPERKRVGPIVTAVLYDHRRKILGCTISKVASTSWIRYLATNSMNRSAVVNRTTKIYRYRLKQYGMTNLPSIAVSEILKPRYADWKKYMIVRHPIQRVVSAYYEAMIKLRRFNATFLEYMDRLGNGQYVDEDEHWALYSSWCHMCDIKYDYILKMETMDTDLKEFNKAVGIDENATLPEINGNYVLAKELKRKGEAAADEYMHKYDKHLTIFNKEHPAVFKKVLDLYQKDMDMFGYSWNAEVNSTCGFKGQDGGCC